MVAPVLGYTPAPFNMEFAGTLSVSAETFSRLVGEVLDGLIHHGFGHVYVLNGHGANLQPLEQAVAGKRAHIRIRSWWDFEPVNVFAPQMVR